MDQDVQKTTTNQSTMFLNTQHVLNKLVSNSNSFMQQNYVDYVVLQKISDVSLDAQHITYICTMKNIIQSINLFAWNSYFSIFWNADGLSGLPV